jgi:hypothetical protein
MPASLDFELWILAIPQSRDFSAELNSRQASSGHSCPTTHRASLSLEASSTRRLLNGGSRNIEGMPPTPSPYGEGSVAWIWERSLSSSEVLSAVLTRVWLKHLEGQSVRVSVSSVAMSPMGTDSTAAMTAAGESSASKQVGKAFSVTSSSPSPSHKPSRNST